MLFPLHAYLMETMGTFKAQLIVYIVYVVITFQALRFIHGLLRLLWNVFLAVLLLVLAPFFFVWSLISKVFSRRPAA